MTLVDNQKLLVEKRKSLRRKHLQNSIDGHKANGAFQIAQLNKPENDNKALVKSHSQAMRIYHDSDETEDNLKQVATSLSARDELELESKMNELNALNKRELSRNDIINTNYLLNNEEAENMNKATRFSKGDDKQTVKNNQKRIEKIEPTRTIQNESVQPNDNRQKEMNKKEASQDYYDYDKSKISYLEAKENGNKPNELGEDFKEINYNNVDANANDDKKSNFKKSKKKKTNKTKQENSQIGERKETIPVSNKNFYDNNGKNEQANYPIKSNRKMATDWNTNGEVENERFDKTSEERHEKYGNAISTISKSMNRYRFK
jgi:hypothetical protein